MSTPALARATEALCTADTSYWHHEQTDDYPCSSCVEKAQTAVSAALHDPDDAEGLWLYGAAIDAAAASLGTTLLTESYIVAVRAGVDAVRAAILGGGDRT